MKILMLTVHFAPARGGVPTVVDLLSKALAEKGHEVCVATLQPSDSVDQQCYRIIRSPSRSQLMQLYRWAQGIVLHGPIIRLGWPLAFTTKRAWMVHHMWPEKETSWLVPVIRKVLNWRCRHLAVSRAFASAISPSCRVVPNPYDDTAFMERPARERDKDIIFVGRLIPQKGADTLIRSLEILATQGLHPSTTVVGSGSELATLREQAQTAGMDTQIRFVGEKPKQELAVLLNEHRMMVIPSRWDEGFGIVALEGLASGCAVVASRTGGLPEALGECGHLFEAGDAMSLAHCVKGLLNGGRTPQPDSILLKKHLAAHTPEAVADRYLEVLLA